MERTRVLHRASISLALLLTLVVLTTTAQSGSSSLVFVSQPILLDSGRYTDYSSIRMFTVDSNATLDSLWQSPQMKIGGIRVFPDAGTMLVQRGGGYNGIVQVYATTNARFVCEINPTVTGSTILRSHQYVTGEDLGLAAFDLIINDSKDPELTVFVSPREVAKTGQVNGEEPSGELRVAGDWPDIGETVDRVEFPDSGIVPTLPVDPVPGLVEGAFPIPDSAVWITRPTRWSLIAHEPTFLAISTLGRGSRNLLIYSRPEKKWTSVLVAGTTHAVRPVGGWLVVEGSELAATVSAGHDTKFPEAGNATLALVNPLTLKTLVLRIEGGAEVLWIENDMIFYHTLNKLYRGHIADTDITDRKLLATDNLIVNTHWAFRAAKVPANRH